MRAQPRLSALGALPPVCSPPFGALEGSSGDGDFNVYRACVGNTAGLATRISSFNDAGVTTDGVRNPVLSPDGTKILFEMLSNATGFPEIWVVSSTPASTATQLVADASNYCMHPSWSPDNDTFVYVKGAGGAISGGSILKDQVTAIGSPATLKSAGGGKSPYRPQYNYAGDRVAYIFDTDIGGTGELRVMHDDGSSDASIDSAVKYRFQGGQFSWAHASNKIVYDDGASGSNLAYVINSDGTGRVQINSAGTAAGAGTRVSDRAWPPDDSYAIISANLGVSGFNPIHAALDGSTTTTILTTHGAEPTTYWEQVLVADGRIWWIETANVDTVAVASCLIDGTDYRADLTIDGVAMSDISTGDGFFYN